MASSLSNHLIIVNAITLSRFFFAALFIYLVSVDLWWLVLVIGPFAFTTDWFDGKLARRWSVDSSFGKFVDPLSDKALSLTVLWLIVIHYEFSWFYLLATVLISIYDVGMVGARLANAKKSKKMTGASRLAKIKTMVLMQALTFIVLGIVLDDTSAAQFVQALGAIWLGASVVLTARSAYGYRHLFGIRDEN